MLKSRLSAFLSLLAVFVSGGVVGIFTYRAYNPPPVLQRPPRPEDIRKHIEADMKKAVNLDDQQVAEVDKILDEIKVQGDELRTRMNAEGRKIRDHQVDEIDKILRDDQKPLYKKWLADRQAERQRRQQQQQQQQGIKEIRK